MSIISTLLRVAIATLSISIGAAASAKDGDAPGTHDKHVFDTKLVPFNRGLGGPEVVWSVIDKKPVALFETDEPTFYPFRRSEFSNVYAYAEGDATPMLIQSNAKILCFVAPSTLVLRVGAWDAQEALTFRKAPAGWVVENRLPYKQALSNECANRESYTKKGWRYVSEQERYIDGSDVSFFAAPKLNMVELDLVVRKGGSNYLFENRGQSSGSVFATSSPSRYVFKSGNNPPFLLDTSTQSLEVFPDPTGILSMTIRKNEFIFPLKNFNGFYIKPLSPVNGFPLGLFSWDGSSSSVTKLLSLKRYVDSDAWVSIGPNQCFSMVSTISSASFSYSPTIRFVNLCS